MFYRLGGWTHDRRWLVVACWLTLAVGLRLAAPDWTEVAFDGDLDQLPADTTTMRADRLNALAFPEDVSNSQIVLVVARDDVELTVDDRQYALDLAKLIEERDDLPIVDIWTEKTPVVGPMLKSRAGRAQRIVIRLTNDLMATDNMRVLSIVEELVDESAKHRPDGLQIGITGSAAIGGDMLRSASESVENIDRATIILVVPRAACHLPFAPADRGPARGHRPGEHHLARPACPAGRVEHGAWRPLAGGPRLHHDEDFLSL